MSSRTDPAGQNPGSDLVLVPPAAGLPDDAPGECESVAVGVLVVRFLWKWEL